MPHTGSSSPSPSRSQSASSPSPSSSDDDDEIDFEKEELKVQPVLRELAENVVSLSHVADVNLGSAEQYENALVKLGEIAAFGGEEYDQGFEAEEMKKRAEKIMVRQSIGAFDILGGMASSDRKKLQTLVEHANMHCRDVFRSSMVHYSVTEEIAADAEEMVKNWIDKNMGNFSHDNIHPVTTAVSFVGISTAHGMRHDDDDNEMRVQAANVAMKRVLDAVCTVCVDSKDGQIGGLFDAIDEVANAKARNVISSFVGKRTIETQTEEAMNSKKQRI